MSTNRRCFKFKLPERSDLFECRTKVIGDLKYSIDHLVANFLMKLPRYGLATPTLHARNKGGHNLVLNLCGALCRFSPSPSFSSLRWISKSNVLLLMESMVGEDFVPHFHWPVYSHKAMSTMKQYVILRRGGWANPEELGIAAARSKKVGDEECPNEVRWIRSYVLNEANGSVGTVCIYEAVSPEAIRKHAECAKLPIDEIIPIADTVVVRPDPLK